MRTAIVLFTRDLRVHDNPALALACARAERVVPLFVVDEALPAVPNRIRFLVDALADLRAALRGRGGDLVIRRGDPVTEVVRLAGKVAAEGVFVARDVSHHAGRRARRLGDACSAGRMDLTLTPGLTVVPPGELTPAGGDHYRVFTPYWRVWWPARWRNPAGVPEAVRLPPGIAVGRIPAGPGGCSPGLAPGGERAGRERMRGWLRDGLAGYAADHDDLAADRTSRLSAHLRFGCVSPLELARAARPRAGGQEYCRQLAWRDFHHQVTAAFPDIARVDYRPGGIRWNDDEEALAAWREGRTGVPIVDAGMRQLAAEGFMHNRARLIVASFLTKTLRIDWRHGYRYFFDLLADGDVADNGGNWQWVAGTGNDTRPNRVLSPLRQARRFDRDGGYVRRYVPELAGLDARHVHEPWRLPADRRRRLGYPAPIVDLG